MQGKKQGGGSEKKKNGIPASRGEARAMSSTFFKKKTTQSSQRLLFGTKQSAVNLNALAEAERHYKRDLHVERKFVDEKDFGTEEEDEPVRGERNDEESERGSDQKKDTREEDDWTAQATTIFVANLNWSTKKEDLHILFSPIGKM